MHISSKTGWSLIACWINNKKEKYCCIQISVSKYVCTVSDLSGLRWQVLFCGKLPFSLPLEQCNKPPHIYIYVEYLFAGVIPRVCYSLFHSSDSYCAFSTFPIIMNLANSKRKIMFSVKLKAGHACLIVYAIASWNIEDLRTTIQLLHV